MKALGFKQPQFLKIFILVRTAKNTRKQISASDVGRSYT